MPRDLVTMTEAVARGRDLYLPVGGPRGIGFTITLLCGFFVLIVGLDGIMSGIMSLINSALGAAADLVGAPAAGVR